MTHFYSARAPSFHHPTIQYILPSPSTTHPNPSLLNAGLTNQPNGRTRLWFFLLLFPQSKIFHLFYQETNFYFSPLTHKSKMEENQSPQHAGSNPQLCPVMLKNPSNETTSNIRKYKTLELCLSREMEGCWFLQTVAQNIYPTLIMRYSAASWHNLDESVTLLLDYNRWSVESFKKYSIHVHRCRSHG